MNLHAVKASVFAHFRGAAPAGNQIKDFSLGELARRGKHHLQAFVERHCGRRHGFLVHAFGALFAGVVDLHPDFAAIGLTGFGPLLQQGHVAVVFNHDVARLCTCPAVNHHIPGYIQTDATGCPALVDPHNLWCNPVVARAQGFAHGGFHQAVGNSGAARQCQWVAKFNAHRGGLRWF